MKKQNKRSQSPKKSPKAISLNLTHKKSPERGAEEKSSKVKPNSVNRSLYAIVHGLNQKKSSVANKNDGNKKESLSTSMSKDIKGIQEQPPVPERIVVSLKKKASEQKEEKTHSNKNLIEEECDVEIEAEETKGKELPRKSNLVQNLGKHFSSKIDDRETLKACNQDRKSNTQSLSIPNISNALSSQINPQITSQQESKKIGAIRIQKISERIIIKRTMKKLKEYKNVDKQLLLSKYINHCATFIQKHFKGCKIRKNYKTLLVKRKKFTQLRKGLLKGWKIRCIMKCKKVASLKKVILDITVSMKSLMKLSDESSQTLLNALKIERPQKIKDFIRIINILYGTGNWINSFPRGKKEAIAKAAEVRKY